MVRCIKSELSMQFSVSRYNYIVNTRKWDVFDVSIMSNCVHTKLKFNRQYRVSKQHKLALPVIFIIVVSENCYFVRLCSFSFWCWNKIGSSKNISIYVRGGYCGSEPLTLIRGVWRGMNQILLFVDDSVAVRFPSGRQSSWYILIH